MSQSGQAAATGALQSGGRSSDLWVVITRVQDRLSYKYGAGTKLVTNET